MKDFLTMLVAGIAIGGVLIFTAEAGAAPPPPRVAHYSQRAADVQYARRMLLNNCVRVGLSGYYACPMPPPKSGKSFQGNIGDGTAGRPACTGYTVWMYWSNGYRTWQCRWASAPGYYWAVA